MKGDYNLNWESIATSSLQQMDCVSQFQKLYASETKRYILLIWVLVSAVILFLSYLLPYRNLVVSSFKSSFYHSPSVDGSNLTDPSMVVRLVNVPNSTNGEIKLMHGGETDMISQGTYYYPYMDVDQTSNFKSYSQKPVVFSKNSKVKNAVFLDHEQGPSVEKIDKSDPEDSSN